MITLAEVGLYISIVAGVIAFAIVFMKIGSYREKVLNSEKRLDKIDGKIEPLMNEIKNLLSLVVKSRRNKVKREISESNSPLVLSGQGKELLKRSGFDEIFEQEKDKLVKLLEERKPNKKYQVQEGAEFILINVINNPELQKLQIHVYNNPEDSIELILYAGAIKLRDYYLEKHSEIKE